MICVLIANFGRFCARGYGFGFALVTMSILPLFMDLTDLTVVTILLGLVVNFSIIYSLKVSELNAIDASDNIYWPE